MSSKRKPDGTKKAVKKRKNSESNYDSDLSDEYPRAGGGTGAGGEPSAAANREVLVEELRPMEKLPEELLGAYDKGPGKLLIAGMVSWEMTGKRDSKGVTKIRPNLFSFHRFTGETVGARDGGSGGGGGGKLCARLFVCVCMRALCVLVCGFL